MYGRSMRHVIADKYASTCHYIFNEDIDYPERVGGIYYPLSVILAYLLLVKIIGPLLMKPLKPLRINRVLIAFNIFIVCWNAYISLNLFHYMYVAVKTGVLCNHLHSAKHGAYKFIWSFYLSKYADLLDTLFFVLRKKQRQVSFLHVFHHSVVIMIVWGGIRFDSTGHNHVLTLALNSFVHVCTYSYYALSACGPKMQKFLNPIKIYLTFIQVVQFWIIMAYISWSTFTGCEPIDVWVGTTAVFVFILMLLFADFYVQNYSKKKQ